MKLLTSIRLAHLVQLNFKSAIKIKITLKIASLGNILGYLLS